MGTDESNVYFSRWIILAACLVFMTLSGNVYGFGLVSDEIKSRLGLSQTQLDIVATVCICYDNTYNSIECIIKN